MNNSKLAKIASITLGVIISILLLVMGFKVLSGVFTRATDYEPRDVVISNIDQNSARISWTTGVETQGVIEYGTSPTSLSFFAPEAQKTKNHFVDLTLLSPASTYYFQIRIGDKKYDNGGVPWSFTTKGTERSQSPNLASSPTPTLTPPAIPTLSENQTITLTPTPIQSLQIPNETGTTTTQVCAETDCAKIKEKLGEGCTTQDYFRCLKKLTPTLTPTSSP